MLRLWKQWQCLVRLSRSPCSTTQCSSLAYLPSGFVLVGIPLYYLTHRSGPHDNTPVVICKCLPFDVLSICRSLTSGSQPFSKIGMLEFVAAQRQEEAGRQSPRMGTSMLRCLSIWVDHNVQDLSPVVGSLSLWVKTSVAPSDLLTSKNLDINIWMIPDTPRTLRA